MSTRERAEEIFAQLEENREYFLRVWKVTYWANRTVARAWRESRGL